MVFKRLEAAPRRVALYSATKHAVAGYSEALDHELRTMGIRVSVIEPAYINTPFDANLMKPDAPLDVYREVRAGVEKRVKEVLEGADGPDVVAEIVLKAAMVAHPKIHYAPGLASRMRLLRRFAPASVLDAGVRKDLRLEASAVRQE
jgi:short-subunit dehydrogenase